MQPSKVVVVTGASAGVGRAAAVAFGAEGARVGLLARGQEGLDAAVKEVEGCGGEAIAISTDVADHDAVESAADAVEDQLGPIDVWVNNAMTSVFAPFTEVKPEEFRRVTDVTFLGYANGTRAALERMLPRDRGVIVQVGSALAHRGIPLQSAYCAAKHAIQGMTESVRCELLHDRSGVRICMVQMPALNTPQFDWVLSRLAKRAQPVPPIFQPEVAAAAIVYASKHPRREVWVGEPTVATVIANKVVPGLLDHYLGRTGYASQQTDEPDDHDRRFNLWEPVPGDHGSHGRFDRRAHDWSAQAWATTHRRWVAAGLAAVGAAALAWRRA